jgi:hypothetical protein
MYSFANREDTAVVDEPMYAYFLNLTGDNHPGKDEIIKSQPITMSGVKKDLLFNHVDKAIYFIKGMAKHYLDVDYSFLLELDNLFLIRDPAQLLVSFQKIIPNPSMKDIGLKREWDIFEYLLSNGKQPIVLDSNAVLTNPRESLNKLCDALSIPFSDRMLAWEKGPIAEDGVWAPHWYANVHQSTCFAQANNTRPEVPENLSALYEESMIYYKKLLAHHLLK